MTELEIAQIRLDVFSLMGFDTAPAEVDKVVQYVLSGTVETAPKALEASGGGDGSGT